MSGSAKKGRCEACLLHDGTRSAGSCCRSCLPLTKIHLEVLTQPHHLSLLRSIIIPGFQNNPPLQNGKGYTILLPSQLSSKAGAVLKGSGGSKTCFARKRKQKPSILPHVVQEISKTKTSATKPSQYKQNIPEIFTGPITFRGSNPVRVGDPARPAIIEKPPDPTRPDPTRENISNTSWPDPTRPASS